MKLIKDKSFYLALIALVVPIAFQDLLKHGLNLADNIMVGMLSEVELSAVNLANQPFFLFSIMIFGLVSGGTVLISQYYGKNDFNAINKIISITLAIALSYTFIFAFVILLFPQLVMKFFTNDSDVIFAGVRYLRIIGWTYLLYGISNTLVLILRSLRLIKTTLLINTIAFFMNIILDWILIFGKFNFPALGIEGAALATLIARIFETSAIIIYINKCDKRICVKLKNLFHLDKILFTDFVKYGFPVLINELIWGIGIVVFSVILGHLGTQAIAASSITACLEQFVSVVLYGIANATCIIVGNAVGASKKDYARQCADTLLFLSIVFGLIVGLAIFLLREPIINFYNIESQTKNLAMQFMCIASVLVFIDSIGLVSIVGILRGGGDTKFAMYVDVLTLWLISVPGGIICAFILHLPFIIVFIALRLDIIVKSLLCLFRLRNDNWIINVTR